MSAVRIALLLIVSLGPLCSEGLAHKPSDSYLRITGGGPRLTAEWDIALKDLEFLVGLDANQNGEITWGELKVQRPAIVAHALSRLRIDADGHEYSLDVGDLLVTRHSDGAYAVLKLDTDAPGDAAELTVYYDLLFDADPTHRGLVLYNNGVVSKTHVISPDDTTLILRTDQSSLWQTFADYVREGVWHIWIGFDHILFLTALLLPTVFVRQAGSWRPADEFRPTCLSVLRIVTVFTVAHSITLWLAVMEYVALPGWIVEATIAFSIVVTAVNNLFRLLPVSGWVIAFLFGLVHGFGFANVLVDLGLSSFALGISLLGFNVGVELGQVAIVLVFLPIAFALRGTLFYRAVVYRFGSAATAVIAGIWMYERVANATILGF